MLLLAQEVNRYEGDREGEDLNSWKPEVPFMAGSFEDPERETSHIVLTRCSLPVTGSPY